MIELSATAIMGHSPLEKALAAFQAESLLLGYCASRGNRFAGAMLEKMGMTPDEVLGLWGWQVGVDGTNDNDW